MIKEKRLLVGGFIVTEEELEAKKEITVYRTSRGFVSPYLDRAIHQQIWELSRGHSEKIEAEKHLWELLKIKYGS